MPPADEQCAAFVRSWHVMHHVAYPMFLGIRLGPQRMMVKPNGS
jgi:hypothetical protein